MSDFRAIGGVSASLQALLMDRMELPTGVSAPLVTVSTPRAEAAEATEVAEAARINLFLYAVAEHPSLKNQEIPGRGHPAAFGSPPLSLTLHYLLTAYGASPTPGLDDVADETTAHMLLGSAMRVLHDVPVITSRVTTRRPPVGAPILHESLRGEFEQVKVVLDPASLENVTKVWTALAQRFRLSAAYTVSVVQIESTRPRVYPRPVGEPPAAGPRVHVVALRRVHLAEVRVRRAAETEERRTPYARTGDTLVLLGSGFAAGTRVVLGTVEVEVTPVSLERIEVVVPDHLRPDGTLIPEEERLQPGAHPVAVVAPVAGLGGVGFRSNHAVFMLVPHVTALTMDLGVVPRELVVQGTRLHHPDRTGETIVGRAVVPRTSYTAATATQLRVPLPDSLPARAVPVLRSGPLVEPLALADPRELAVTVAGVDTRTATIAAETTLPAVAAAIERALHDEAAGVPAFRDLRVAAVADRLVLLAGQLAQAVTVAAGTTAGELALAAPAASTLPGHLSGTLRPFPAITSAQPTLRVTLGGVVRDVVVATRPATIEDAADLLQDAINVAGPEPAFTQALVAVLGDQLLVVPGAAGDVDVGPVPGVDEASAAELQLRASYAVRVRVNGAESVDDVVQELPS